MMNNRKNNKLFTLAPLVFAMVGLVVLLSLVFPPIATTQSISASFNSNSDSSTLRGEAVTPQVQGPHSVPGAQAQAVPGPLYTDEVVRTDTTGKVINKSPMKVVFVGDIGTEKSGKATIQAIKNEKPDLAILLGDLGYSDSSKAFATQVEILRDEGIMVYCTIGNHDAAEEESKAVEVEYWKLCAGGDKAEPPGNANQFRSGAGFWGLTNNVLTIVGLNTQHPLQISENYLEQGISQAVNDPFVIVTAHKPLCEETPDSKHGGIPCDQGFRDALKSLDTDVTVTAHNHCMAGNLDGEYVTFLSGAGGRSHYSCSDWPIVNDEDFGYLLLTFDRNGMDFVFKDQKGEELTDHFITK